MINWQYIYIYNYSNIIYMYTYIYIYCIYSNFKQKHTETILHDVCDIHEDVVLSDVLKLDIWTCQEPLAEAGPCQTLAKSRRLVRGHSQWENCPNLWDSRDSMIIIHNIIYS